MSEESKTEIAPALPSATTVILRNKPSFEVLLLQRNAKIKFHGGSWVFPGGKLDPADSPVAECTFDELTRQEQAESYRRAAIRETIEESGIELNSKSLHLFSTWLTPTQMPKRFDAWFYLAICDDQPVTIDDGEIKDYQWIQPKIALDKHNCGELSLPPPTFVTLDYLQKHSDAQEAISTLTKQVMHFKPRIATIDGGFVSLYEEDAGYASSDPNAEGARHRLVKQGKDFTYIKDV